MAMKGYGGAPFGTQTARFDVSGVHPHNKMPGTYTQVPYCKRANSCVNKMLGPGRYTPRTGDFCPSAVEDRAQGPNWEHAYAMTKFNTLPHMLYRKQWEHNIELRETLGPGRYEVKDFIEILRDKPSSKKGVCQSRDQRFPRGNKFQSTIPGPGTYGMGGIPCAKKDEKEKESYSTVGLLDSGVGHCHVGTLPGSGLAPCRYNHDSSIQQLLDKNISTRGPYDLHTGERYVVPKLILESVHLGPGKYGFKPFTEKLEDKHLVKHGHFSIYPQYPEMPTERHSCATLSQWPRDKDSPGPYTYDTILKDASAPINMKHPFNSTAIRFNQRFFYKSLNPVCAGQYDIVRWDNSQHRNGNGSVFVSKTPRLPPKVDTSRELLLGERLHPKKISQGKGRLMNHHVALL